MPTRDEQHDSGQLDTTLHEIGAAQMPAQVIDADHRNVPTETQTCGRIDADDERTDESWSTRHANGFQIRTSNIRFGERAFNRWNDYERVRATRELGIHAAPVRVNMRLARNDRREHFAVAIDHGCGRVVAR